MGLRNNYKTSQANQRRTGTQQSYSVGKVNSGTSANNNCQNNNQSQNSLTKPANKSSAQTNNRYAFLSNSCQEPVKQLGMTSAISLADPRPEELEHTKKLLRVLVPNEVFETKTEFNHRVHVLAKLNTLFTEWIKNVSIAKGTSEEDAEKLGGKIHTFGSYRIGVHHKGADIDALCVAPRNIERSDYFASFFELLKQQPEVTECRAIEEAFVPVIKMKFDGIEIDLLFARLALKEIPDDFDLLDDNLLKNLDPRSVRSLNGCRVTDEILSLVPNLENFRLTLRCIKLWAKKQGIYSNILGYFGGVTWAMLVARTCQLYPNATASTLVHKFFLIFSRWKWPSPVLLKRPLDVDLNLPVWDPRINTADRYHLMPIITPAYPQQNSTFNVTASTKKVIMKEINRGMSTVNDILFGNASWDDLFQAPSFFYSYKHFIVLLVNSQTADDHLAWRGFVESKIRFLIASLERNYYISLVHAHPKCYDLNEAHKNITSSPYCSMWFLGLEFAPIEKLDLNLTGVISDFTDLVIQHAIKINLFNESMSIDIRYAKRKQLSEYLDSDFLKRERKVMNSFNNATIDKRKRSNETPENCGNNAKRPRFNEGNPNAKSDDISIEDNALSNTTSNLQQPKKAKTNGKATVN